MVRASIGALAVLVLGAALAGCPDDGAAGNPRNVATSGVALTAADVEGVLLRAVAAAEAEGQAAAIAVTDREGEVLGVYVMAGRDVDGDGTLDVPGPANVATAISKAATASAFQSEGEAFTTRTAFFIVQGHYPPGVEQTAGGPLFGVQDSGQPSSDAHVLAYDALGSAVGAGISGELGGVPLYAQGSPVGGVGVDTVTPLVDRTGPAGTGTAPTIAAPLQDDVDERIARAAVGPLETPAAIDATNVFVDGQAFPFYGRRTRPGVTPPLAATLAALPAGTGALHPDFPLRASPLAPEVRSGAEYGVRATHRYLGRVGARSSPTFLGTLQGVDRPAGVTFDPATLRFTGVPIVPLAERAVAGGPGEDRAPAIDSLEPPPAEGGLSAAEVEQVIAAAVADARASVAGIRLPRGSHVTVHVAVVDRRGNLLGLYRMADGTLFSADIAVQKARTCAFFSSDGSAGLPAVAFSARAIGFLAQPYFPPGIEGTRPGPLAYLRDLVNRGKLVQEPRPSLTLLEPPPRLPSDGTTDEDPTTPGNQRFADYPGGAPAELAEVRAILAATGGIALLADRADTTPDFVSPGLQSGLMTFPGGVPLYRGSTLIGAVGVSGDGVDEDDAAAFAGSQVGFEPPRGTRCDEVSEHDVRTVLAAKLDLLAAAVQAHPDPRIRNVYGPLVAAERDRAQARLQQGLDGVRLPYVKLPRNPGNF